MNAVEVKNLTKYYRGFTLDHISFSLPGGCIMGLIGENGAGKSTIIKLLLGIIRKDEGSISLFGRGESGRQHLLKDEVGFVLDELKLNCEFRAKNINNIMSSAYRHWNSETFYGLLDKMNIPVSKRIKAMSRGMKMKVGIAIAMSHNAKLLILDEATGGLDPVVRDEVVDMLYEFTRDEEHSVLISSHIVSDLEKLCDYIAFLHHGKLVLCEEKDRLMEQYGMIHCTEKQLSELDCSAVIGKKSNQYGAEAIVRRDAVPKGLDIGPTDIEKLFVFMNRGNHNEEYDKK